MKYEYTNPPTREQDRALATLRSALSYIRSTCRDERGQHTSAYFAALDILWTAYHLVEDGCCS